jgi:hypothetical protein
MDLEASIHEVIIGKSGRCSGNGRRTRSGRRCPLVPAHIGRSQERAKLKKKPLTKSLIPSLMIGSYDDANLCPLLISSRSAGFQWPLWQWPL